MRKPVFIVFLLTISLSASIFMIIESGSFFQELYQDRQSVAFMGYWAAFLNEVFMGIMAAVWLPAGKERSKESAHPVNYLFKVLLVFLFVTTVCGSSLKTVYPLTERLQQQAKQEKVIEILQSQVKDNQQSLDTFVQQNQRVNAALTVRNQVKVKEELKQVYQSKESLFRLYVQIIIVVLLRFGVQLANLSCIWLAGWVFRQPAASQQQQQSIKPETPVAQQHEQVQADRHPRFRLRSAEPGRTREKDHHATPRSIHSSPKNRQTPGSSVEDDKINELRKRISSMLKSRNEGVSLAQIGKAIGEKESHLLEIVNPRIRIGNGSRPALENILSKIEQLYHEEQASSF